MSYTGLEQYARWSPLAGLCSYRLPLWSSFFFLLFFLFSILKSAEIEKVPANIYYMKRTAIWRYLQQISEQNYPQLLGKTKEGITTVHIHTDMVGFFGTSAASDHCHLLPRNGSIHHELRRPQNDKPRSVIRCCSKSRGRTRDYYYQVLGITVHSTSQEIKDAYRKLQKQHHPDIAGYKVHPFPSLILPFALLFFRSSLFLPDFACAKKRTAASFILTASNINCVLFCANFLMLK